MHSKNHSPTCFKYGNTTKCRSKFPRTLVGETQMDPGTGLIRLKRDDPWMNGYNPWIMVMLRANHDCKFLFSQIYALAIIHYVMKYISKPEQATHAKLTIVAAVRKELNNINDSSSATPPLSPGRQMLSKVYNRLDSHREVGLPEAISHLCGFPDHYSSVTFVNINTKTLLYYVHRRYNQNVASMKMDRTDDDDIDNNDKDTSSAEVFDSQILHTRHGYRLPSPFDDYIYQGEHLSDICLYNYFSLLYKERSSKGIQFDHGHPQANTNSQILHKSSQQVPNLLGRILFLRLDSKDEQMKEDYYCLVVALFIPWSDRQPFNPTATSWEDWYLNHAPQLPPRIARLIQNLQLLHKTKDEIDFDRIQRASLDGEDDIDTLDPGDERDPDEAILNAIYDSDDDEEIDGTSNESTTTSTPVPSLEHIEAAALDMDTGFYVQEALDAGCDYKYFDNSPDIEMKDQQPDWQDEDFKRTIFLTHLSPHHMGAILEEAAARSEATTGSSRSGDIPVRPHVYLSWGPKLDDEIQVMVEEFSLNEEQARAFAIIARQSCRKHQLAANPSMSVTDSKPQLLMGLFGEGGTGKSRVISAIRKWFEV